MCWVLIVLEMSIDSTERICRFQRNRRRKGSKNGAGLDFSFLSIWPFCIGCGRDGLSKFSYGHKTLAGRDNLSCAQSGCISCYGCMNLLLFIKCYALQFCWKKKGRVTCNPLFFMGRAQVRPRCLAEPASYSQHSSVVGLQFSKCVTSVLLSRTVGQNSFCLWRRSVSELDTPEFADD
jgi:hypothetical protein